MQNRSITNHKQIKIRDRDCGYIQTIESVGFKAVEVEYFLDEDCRHQGIMSSEFPIYIRELENRGYRNILAHVKENNFASKKILKRNGFKKFDQIRNIEVFVLLVGIDFKRGYLERVKAAIVNDFIF
tara:strand:- start:37371 stop:37751 length:381 start_codon:yes stop_codon:yes gene_type:complete